LHPGWTRRRGLGRGTSHGTPDYPWVVAGPGFAGPRSPKDLTSQALRRAPTVNWGPQDPKPRAVRPVPRRSAPTVTPSGLPSGRQPAKRAPGCSRSEVKDRLERKTLPLSLRDAVVVLDPEVK